MKFWPNFMNFGNFSGDRIFFNTKIENPAYDNISQYTSSVAMYEHVFVSFICNKEKTS